MEEKKDGIEEYKTSEEKEKKKEVKPKLLLVDGSDNSFWKENYLKEKCDPQSYVIANNIGQASSYLKQDLTGVLIIVDDGELVSNIQALKEGLRKKKNDLEFMLKTNIPEDAFKENEEDELDFAYVSAENVFSTIKAYIEKHTLPKS